MSVLIIGGTGQVGREVLQRLTRRLESISVLSHRASMAGSRPKGIHTVIADLEKPDTLPEAMRGITRVILITPVYPNERQMGLNALHAAKAAGVRHIIFLSVHRVEECPEAPHFLSKIEIQRAIEASGLAYTFVMPNNFFQNDLMLERPIVDHGVYAQPFGDKGLSRVDVRDIADAIVAVATENGHEGRRYPVVGPDVLTATETAEIWSRKLGRPVRYIGDDLDAWARQTSSVMPSWMVDDLRIMFRFFQERGLAATPDELALTGQVLGHTPRRFDDFATETAEAWAAVPTGPIETAP